MDSNLGTGFPPTGRETLDQLDAPFDQDFATLQADMDARDGDIANEKVAHKAFKDQLDNIDRQINAGVNPMVILMEFIALFSDSGSAKMDDLLGVEGDNVAINGDITQCAKDCEDITNNTQTLDGNGKNTGKVGTNSWTIQAEARCTDQLLEFLDPKTAGKDSGATVHCLIDSATGNSEVSEAVGDSTVSAVTASLLNIRKDICITDNGTTQEDTYSKTNYNPIESDGTEPAANQGFHFCDYADYKDTNTYMLNYEQMHEFEGQQGDKKGATEAGKTITESFGTVTSTTQGESSSLNQMITYMTNQIKTIQSFTTDMMHAMSDVEKAAVQNYSKG